MDGEDENHVGKAPAHCPTKASLEPSRDFEAKK